MMENLSWENLQFMGRVRPDIAIALERWLVDDYKDFVDVLNRELDLCIAYIEENPGVRAYDGEERLTVEIIGLLKARGYTAGHDEFVGGHSDLVVRHAKGYLWLGEAKIHHDYDYLQQGFNQLCTRYSRGTPNANCGSLILYIRTQDAASVIAEWRKRLKDLGFSEMSDEDCPLRGGLAFTTEHIHEASGLPVSVRHIGVVQYFSPKDRKSQPKAKTNSSPGQS